MKVLVIGSGAREHALVWKLAQSPVVDHLYAAPGNAGTSQLATNLDVKITDFNAIDRAVRQNRIDFIVVGPENPLAEGIVDYFQKTGVPIFGPTRNAAQLESSKALSKELFQTFGIPCARSRTFTDITSARQYATEQGAPIVVKADGLAAGKGVIMAESQTEAFQAISSIMENKSFGSAGDKVIIEEKLAGKEMSYFAVTDGKSILPLMPACDYKRVNDGDQGLNTGGMGSYSPPYFFTRTLDQKILTTIIGPTVEAMEKSGRPYKGVLFAGLMVNLDSGREEPRLLEYNVRFGDPECQVIMPRLKSDLMDIMLGVTKGNLETMKPQWSEDACVGVVMASGGYPGNYKTGLPIGGLDGLDKDVIVFHAGTKSGTRPGEVLTNGGRVLTVVALGKTTQEAREKIYANISRIKFEGAHYRTDIGLV